MVSRCREIIALFDIDTFVISFISLCHQGKWHKWYNKKKSKTSYTQTRVSVCHHFLPQTLPLLLSFFCKRLIFSNCLGKSRTNFQKVCDNLILLLLCIFYFCQHKLILTALQNLFCPIINNSSITFWLHFLAFLCFLWNCMEIICTINMMKPSY